MRKTACPVVWKGYGDEPRNPIRSGEGQQGERSPEVKRMRILQGEAHVVTAVPAVGVSMMAVVSGKLDSWPTMMGVNPFRLVNKLWDNNV